MTWYLDTSITTNDQGNMQAALSLAAAGFVVFPVGPNKRPKLKGWQDKATADARQIKRWFTKWPDAMPGLPTGRRNGVAVLDIDRHGDKDGDAALRALAHDPNALSMVTVATPSGGRHLYFRWPEGMGNNDEGLPAGVDVRGEGGFVVTPGAVNGKGTYAALSGALGDALPDWPDALMPRRRSAKPGTGKPTGLPFDIFRAAAMACPNDGDAYASRDDWLTFAMSIHTETGGGDDGRQLFLEWSALWPGHDPDAAEAAWDSFNAGKGVSGWHVINEARRHGWRDATVDEMERQDLAADFDDDDASFISDVEMAEIEELVGTPDRALRRRERRRRKDRQYLRRGGR